ncbi:MAG TPA: Bcr/CflA family multidrug efflux MFS transporter [bacterium]|nr:Bcr/CflA family multidrug efflux MFS transporter [bacterium]
MPPTRYLIALLGALAAFGPMSIDMYLPSLPTIAQDFGVPVSEVQLTLSAFFLGFAIGQLTYGTLSDRFGRRPVLITGIAFYIFTSALCAASAGVGTMAAARLVQALGGGAASVISRAIVRDLFGGNQAARVMSLMVMVTGLAPLGAPLLGGQVLLWLGWRAIFWVLAAFGTACLLAVLRGVPETNPPERRRPLRLGAMLGGYWEVLRNRQALGTILAGAMAFAGMFAYISGTPFVYIELYGISPQLYGFLFGLNIVGMMIGAYCNSRLVMHLGSGFMLGVGTVLICAAGLALLACAWSGVGGLLGIVVPLFFYVGSLNLISANAVSRTLQHFPRIAGTAAALYGATQFGFGAFSGALVGLLYNGTAVPMAAVIACAGVLSLAAERLLSRA